MILQQSESAGKLAPASTATAAAHIADEFCEAEDEEECYDDSHGDGGDDDDDLGEIGGHELPFQNSGDGADAAAAAPMKQAEATANTRPWMPSVAPFEDIPAEQRTKTMQTANGLWHAVAMSDEEFERLYPLSPQQKFV
jgi:hypothetical protein